jgi:hypothetical protein
MFDLFIVCLKSRFNTAHLPKKQKSHAHAVNAINICIEKNHPSVPKIQNPKSKYSQCMHIPKSLLIFAPKSKFLISFSQKV